jgi:phosphoenolpyruvate-protein kinase (PTS system EI component)
MAADPLFVALLVGLGFRALSMTPSAIPVVKRSLAALDSRKAAAIARLAVRARSADEVGALLEPVAEVLHRAAVAPMI